MINPASYNNNYSYYNNTAFHNPGNAVDAVNPVTGVKPVNNNRAVSGVKKTESSECQTCKNRKYVDGSDDMGVSFKTPTNISPQASFGAVSAHENEHVQNAISEGNQPGASLISASVRLKTAVCPECGTPYVSGGVTRTTIKYEVQNPYGNNRKSAESSLLKGRNVDRVA